MTHTIKSDSNVNLPESAFLEGKFGKLYEKLPDSFPRSVRIKAILSYLNIVGKIPLTPKVKKIESEQVKEKPITNGNLTSVKQVKKILKGLNVVNFIRNFINVDSNNICIGRYTFSGCIKFV